MITDFEIYTSTGDRIGREDTLDEARSFTETIWAELITPAPIDIYARQTGTDRTHHTWVTSYHRGVWA